MTLEMQLLLQDRQTQNTSLTTRRLIGTLTALGLSAGVPVSASLLRMPNPLQDRGLRQQPGAGMLSRVLQAQAQARTDRVQDEALARAAAPENLDPEDQDGQDA